MEDVRKIVDILQSKNLEGNPWSEVKVDVYMSILKLAVHQSYKKGETIVALQETYTDLGFLLKGAIRSYYIDGNGNDRTKHFYIENDFFMDEVLVNYEKNICIYEALEECEVLFINAKLLKKIIFDNEELTRIYIACLESGIRYKIGRENSFLTKTATERYLEFREEYSSLEGRIRQSYIATYLGIKPESLSRIRKGLGVK